MHATRMAILEYLRDRSSASVADLAVATTLAPVTVRHHLSLMRHQGLVDYWAEPAGRGRPKHNFFLTVRGKTLAKGDPHEALAKRLVAVAKQRDAAQAEAMLADVGDHIAAGHEAVADRLDMPERLQVVAQVLSDEGYVVRWQAAPDGAYRLILSECPFNALCGAHPEVCAVDQRVIERLTGAQALRDDWRVEGDEACVYRVLPPDANAGREAPQSL